MHRVTHSILIFGMVPGKARSNGTIWVFGASGENKLEASIQNGQCWNIKCDDYLKRVFCWSIFLHVFLIQLQVSVNGLHLLIWNKNALSYKTLFCNVELVCTCMNMCLFNDISTKQFIDCEI